MELSSSGKRLKNANNLIGFGTSNQKKLKRDGKTRQRLYVHEGG
jgi:hypothetical protein